MRASRERFVFQSRLFLVPLVALLVGGLAFAQSPAGNDKDVQFNDGGTLAGSSEFEYDKTAKALTAKHFDRIIFASQYETESPGTCGIQKAIDECPRGYSTSGNGCLVVLPRKVCTLTQTIYVGKKASEGVGSNLARDGISLIGYGSGQVTNTGLITGGTSLRWAGPTDGTMIDVTSVNFSRLEGFALDGDENGDGNGAGVGILLSADNRVSPSASNSFENIYINNIIGGNYSGGIAIKIDPSGVMNEQTGHPSDDINTNTFSRITIGNNVEMGIHQDGQQTATTRFLDSTIRGESIDGSGLGGVGVMLLDGDMSIEGCSILVGNNGGRYAEYGIYIATGANLLRIQNSTWEIRAPIGVYEEADYDTGQVRTSPTVLQGNVIQMFRPIEASNPPPQNPCAGSPAPTYAIQKRSRGAMYLAGNNIFPFCYDDGVKILLEGHGVLNSSGNTYTSMTPEFGCASPPCQFADWVSVVAMDQFMSQGDPLFGTNALDLYQSSIVLSGPANSTPGAIIFQESNASTQVKLALNSTMLRMYDGANNPFVSFLPYTAAPEVRLESATSLNFLGTSGSTKLVAGTPSGDKVVTIPSATGDVVLDTAAQSLSNKDLTTPTNLFPPTALIGFTWVSATNSPHFCAPASSACHQAANDTTMRMPVPALDATRLECRATANPGGAGKSWTYTVMKNGSATALTCPISATGASCGLTPGSPVAFAVGDQMSLQVVRGGAATNGVPTACTIWTTPNAP